MTFSWLMSRILPKQVSILFRFGAALVPKVGAHVLRRMEEMVCSKMLPLMGLHVHC